APGEGSFSTIRYSCAGSFHRVACRLGELCRACVVVAHDRLPRSNNCCSGRFSAPLFSVHLFIHPCPLSLSPVCRQENATYLFKEIVMAHLVEQMAYVGQTPWHGLGNALTPRQPLDVWAQQAGMNWR